MKYLETIEAGLRAGAKLHAFLSGGGLRVVRLERDAKLIAYGEHPSIDDALAHAAEDLVAGGRPYAEVYGGSKPHYLTGSPTPSSPLDAWVRGGRAFDATADGEDIVVILPSFETTPMPDGAHERAIAGERVEYEARGFRFRTEPVRFASGVPGYSLQVVGDRRGRDPYHFDATRTGRAPTLAAAIEAALNAEPVEVTP